MLESMTMKKTPGENRSNSTGLYIVLETEIGKITHQQDAEQNKLVEHLLPGLSYFAIDRICHSEVSSSSL
jgi:hypothetical protein